MTEQKQKALSVFEMMNNKDFADTSFFAEDVIFNFPGLGDVTGKRRVIVAIKAILRNYKYLKFNVLDLIEEGNKLCAVWTNEGESHKDGKYSNRGITLFEFEDGKIKYISDYFKDTSFANKD